MALKDETPQAAALRNRKTTVEDVEDDSDASPSATTTATSISASSTAGKKGKETEDDKKRKAAIAARTLQQQQPKKSSQLKNLLLSLLVATLGMLIKSGYDKFLYPSRDITIQQTVGLQGNCYKTAYIPGPSDIEISGPDQVAFVSSDDRSWVKDSSFFHRPSKKTAENGGIYTLPLNQKNGSPKEVTLNNFAGEDFHPAGMSIFRFQEPTTRAWVNRLFVINNSHKGDAVEVFDYSSKANTLTHVKTVNSDLFITPKDIAAVDKDRFYLTNYHAMSNKYGRVAEDVAGFMLGSVVYYNGKDTRKVLESMPNPYGED
ncbi:Serum paraoxonase/arylesterase 2 [Dissophora globulifera]|nr:Serum paraoxonase/arylesterase 2 [Dissophora globulifera]